MVFFLGWFNIAIIHKCLVSNIFSANKVSLSTISLIPFRTYLDFTKGTLSPKEEVIIECCFIHGSRYFRA